MNVTLTAFVAATGVAFFNVNKFAGQLFIPYLAWQCFASYLTNAIYRLNTPAVKSISKKPSEKKQ